MKKGTILIALVTLLSFGAFAQIQKGAILVGASSTLGFNSYTPDGGDATTTFNITGKAGYFFIDNLAGGILLDYTSVKDSYNQSGIGLFARYYVQGKIFVGAGFKSNSFKPDGGSKGTWTTIPLEAGYAAFLTDNIAVEPALSYSIDSGDLKGSGFGVNVGFTVYLNRGSK